MENTLYILVICIVAPLIMMLFLLDHKSRITVGFMIIGVFMCLYAAEVNGVLNSLMPYGRLYFTTTVTPISEEIIKALPVLFYAFVISNKKDDLLPISMAVGIGFAILENTYLLVSYSSSVSIFWALVRGFGSGLMHGTCTAMVGYGISFVRMKKKLFWTGTFALLTTAIIFHAIYNSLAMSDYQIVGYVLPILVFVGFFLFTKRHSKTEKKEAI